MDYKTPELLTSYHIGDLMNTASGFQSATCISDDGGYDDAVSCG